MAATVYENIGLDTELTAGNIPATTYRVAEVRDENAINVTVDYSIVGTPHVHRSADTGGNLVRHRHYHYKLLLSQAEYLAVRLLAGKVMYFMPHLRDESSPAAYLETVVVESLGEEVPLVLSTLVYYTVGITLRSADGWSVDA